MTRLASRASSGRSTCVARAGRPMPRRGPRRRRRQSSPSRSRPTARHIQSRTSAAETSSGRRLTRRRRPRRGARDVGMQHRPQPHRVKAAPTSSARARTRTSPRRRGAEDQPLEQRVAGQAVGAVHAGAGDLAGREQARHRRASLEVGLDAAHHVVRRRADRHAIAGQVEAGVAARRGNQRKPGVHGRGIEVLQREEHAARRSAPSRARCARDTRSRGARSPAGS